MSNLRQINEIDVRLTRSKLDRRVGRRLAKPLQRHPPARKVDDSMAAFRMSNAKQQSAKATLQMIDQEGCSVKGGEKIEGSWCGCQWGCRVRSFTRTNGNLQYRQ
jgi:hypothetical protein